MAELPHLQPAVVEHRRQEKEEEIKGEAEETLRLQKGNGYHSLKAKLERYTWSSNDQLVNNQSVNVS